MAKSFVERFWGRVDRSGGPDACWPWTARLLDYGYGAVEYRGRTHAAHRVAYHLATGEELVTHPRSGPRRAFPVICHVCDNPPCVTPRHLFKGTFADNNRDMRAKGRNGDVRGANNPRARLSDGQVADIRAALKSGVSQSQLAREYGVPHPTIWRIDHEIAYSSADEQVMVDRFADAEQRAYWAEARASVALDGETQVSMGTDGTPIGNPADES